MFIMKRTLFVLPLIVIYLINCSLGVVVSWGEKCQYTAECGDHRLVCEAVTAKNITEKICVCDRFHEWNGTLVGCALTYKTEDILGLLQEKYNVSGRIEYEANLIFMAQITAGMIVMAVGLACSLIVTAYCYRMWKQDSELDDVVRHLESIRVHKPTTSRGRKH